jgi:hypothetical protein
MSIVLKGLIGAPSGLLIGLVAGAVFGFGMIAVLGILGFELGIDAVAMGQLPA